MQITKDLRGFFLVIIVLRERAITANKKWRRVPTEDYMEQGAYSPASYDLAGRYERATAICGGGRGAGEEEAVGIPRGCASAFQLSADTPACSSLLRRAP